MQPNVSQRWSSIYSKIKEYTLVPEPAIRFYVDAVLGSIHKQIPGVIVECGCWFAGASLAVCLAQREAFGSVVKPVWLLDKFCGFEDPGPKDGSYALFYQNSCKVSENNASLSMEAQAFFENAAAKSVSLSPEAVEIIFSEYGFTPGQDVFVVPGWVKDTIPKLVPQLNSEGISILRLDVDLYEATRQCLALEPFVEEHGLVLIDDYYHFDGCAHAIHEYLSLPENPYKLRGLPGQGVFYEKRKPETFEFVLEWPYAEKII